MRYLRVAWAFLLIPLKVWRTYKQLSAERKRFAAQWNDNLIRRTCPLIGLVWWEGKPIPSPKGEA